MAYYYIENGVKKQWELYGQQCLDSYEDVVPIEYLTQERVTELKTNVHQPINNKTIKELSCHSVVVETAKAYLLQCEMYDRKGFWLPKAMVLDAYFETSTSRRVFKVYTSFTPTYITLYRM